MIGVEDDDGIARGMFREPKEDEIGSKIVGCKLRIWSTKSKFRIAVVKR